ncbi:hypothetical protein LZ189_08860, partial [Rhodovulum sulfidophilum]|nr:hypothetical protein [Rhodovulum sulfidophilum]
MFHSVFRRHDPEPPADLASGHSSVLQQVMDQPRFEIGSRMGVRSASQLATNAAFIRCIFDWTCPSRTWIPRARGHFGLGECLGNPCHKLYGRSLNHVVEKTCPMSFIDPSRVKAAIALQNAPALD